MIPTINELMVAVGSSLAAAIVAKVTVITALALFAAWLARGSRAAVRHALLAAAFGVTLLLPIASVLVPTVHLGVPVAVENRASALTPLVSGVDQTSPVLMTDDPRDRVISIPHSSRISMSHLLLAGWVAGGAIFLLPLVIGLWQIRSLRRSGLPWRHGQSLAETIALDAGVRRRVEVLLHETVPGPMTCGILHPTIVLPRDAESWNDEDLNRAFVHELEHVRRGDSVSRCLARGACALYWFHPLVWIAWRRLALEAERACDDAVLGRSEATAYADQLVGLAKRLSAARRSPVLAMANRADLATRVRAVLDARQRRGRAGALSLGLATIAGMVLVLSMSSLILVATPQPARTQTVTPAQLDAASVKPFDLKAQDEPSHQKTDPLRLVAQAKPATIDRAGSAAPATPPFEVASVRPHVPNSGFHTPDCSGDRFTSRGIGLMNLLSWTYDLQAGARTEFLQRVPLSMRQFYDVNETVLRHSGKGRRAICI
jgi:beta-lactamase regulating signal transducer with metallopeptidase domain